MLLFAVSSPEDGAARIAFSDGSKTAIPKEPGQVSITDARIGANGTIGWLAEFSEDGVGYPVAEELVLWRAGNELHDVASGHLIAQWDGDFDSANRPAWTHGLDH
jgi:hypothetical protein